MSKIEIKLKQNTKKQKEKVNSNDIINDLIHKFSIYMSFFSDQRKINTIFNEFDDKTSKDLIDLIKFSNQRYKLVKTGSTIENVVNKQLPIIGKMLKMVVEDEFYNSNLINQERRKIYNTPTIIRNLNFNREINNLRMRIKHNWKKNENETLSKNQNDNKAESKKNENGEMKSETKEKKEKENIFKKEKVDENAKNDKLKVDEEMFITQFEKYKSCLKEIGNVEYDLKNEDKENVINTLNKVKFNIKPEDLNILSYHNQLEKSKVTINKDNQYVNIQKLLKFTRSKMNQIENEEGRNKNTFYSERQLGKTGISLKTKTSNYNKSTFYKQNMSKTNDFNNFNKTVYSKKLDILDEDLKSNKSNSTIGFIKYLISKGIGYSLKGNIKNESTEKRFSKTKKIKTKEEIEQKVRNLYFKKGNTKQSNNQNMTNNEIDIEKIKSLPVIDMYKELYQKEKVNFNERLKKEEEKEEIEKDLRRKNRKLINDIRKRSRYPNLYIDDYSIRDNKINKDIFELNKKIGKKHVNKENLNKIIDKYLEIEDN